MNQEIIDRKIRGLEGQAEYIQSLLKGIRYQKAPKGLSYYYDSLANCHCKQAMYDYFIINNIHSFKQHLHTASQLTFFALSLYSHQQFTIGKEILIALLSDNAKLIDTVARLEPKYFVEGRNNPLLSEFKVHMWQLAIQGDYDALQNKVERLAKNGRKKDRELPEQSKDFFSLLMCGDKAGLEALITQHARIKSEDPIIEDFMCFQGTIEAKICWLKGIEVQIDSPLLPKALMPLAPLAHYDDVYEFLEPGYVAPKVGTLERFRYWYSERKKSKALTRLALEQARKKII